MANVTYELAFPPRLEHAAAVDMFRALTAVYPPLRARGAPPRLPVVVFEVLASVGGVRYLLSVAPYLSSTVQAHVGTAVPGVGMAKTRRRQQSWLRAAELSHSGQPDSRLAQNAWTLLGGLTDLGRGELALIQLVLSPSQPLGLEAAPTFWGVVRLAVAGDDAAAAHRLERILVIYRGLGATKLRTLPPRWLGRINAQAKPLDWPLRLSVTCLPLLCALPLGSPQLLGINLARGRQLPPDILIPSDGRRIAEANSLGPKRALTIRTADRLKHQYLISSTGAGKSTVMLGQITADIHDGCGVAVLDPKGDLVHEVLDRIPPERIDDVILYDLAEEQRPVGFNILAGANPYVVTGSIQAIMDQLFDFATNAPRATEALRSAVLTAALNRQTLLEASLLLGVGLRNRQLRTRLTADVTNPELLDYWRWFDTLRPAEQAEVAAPVTRRLRSLLFYPTLRASLGQLDTGFDLADVLANNRILLVPLARGHLGDEPARLIGALVMAKLWSAIQARPREARQPFFVYLDEFQDLIRLPIGMGDVFAQARGFGVGLVVAHQHFDQLTKAQRRDVLSNVRSKVAFRLGAEDARLLAAEFGEDVHPRDLMNLGAYEVMVQLLADNTVTRPATGTTYPPPPSLGQATAVRLRSAERYGRPIAELEQELENRLGGTPGGASADAPAPESRAASTLDNDWEWEPIEPDHAKLP